MKIAVPTMDGKTISEHFGRCNAFLVFEVEGCVIKAKEERPNAQGAEHTCGDQGHFHRDLSSLLSDCQAIVVRGIGGGAFRAVQKNGAKIYRANNSATPEEAIFRLASGTLEAIKDGSCTGH